MEKVENYFAKKLKLINKWKIKLCIRIIQFEMNLTLTIFQEKYYTYGGCMGMQEKCLTIGCYESAWLADLAAAYILENIQNYFKGNPYFGIYRDDDICVTKK